MIKLPKYFIIVFECRFGGMDYVANIFCFA
nr:MAG TPA: hypothetical protein [Caudoviricetes sp.]